jgi:hypothetical protein
MDTEPTESSAYLPATSPEWARYYKRARETRRLGRGQHRRIQRETQRRRRHANVMILVSTAALVAIFGLCYKLLGPSGGEPEGRAAPALARAA